jgi:putative transposase
VHETANVLNKLPKSQQPKAKRALQQIWMAETKNDALVAFDAFVETGGRQIRQGGRVPDQGSRRAAGLLRLPGRALEASAHDNVIESSFATVRHRTVRSKGCLSNKTALAMIFKLAEAAAKCWRRLNGHNQLPKLILGVKFTDGIEVVRSQAQAAAA